MYELIIESDFSAAHRLRNYKGACENLHGHNWKVEMVVSGEKLGPIGMLMDFHDLKDILNAALEKLDHTYLNEVEEFTADNPTTENIARLIYRMCSAKMPAGVSVASVAVWESERCGARYSEPAGRSK